MSSPNRLSANSSSAQLRDREPSSCTTGLFICISQHLSPPPAKYLTAVREKTNLACVQQCGDCPSEPLMTVEQPAHDAKR